MCLYAYLTAKDDVSIHHYSTTLFEVYPLFFLQKRKKVHDYAEGDNTRCLQELDQLQMQPGGRRDV